MMRKAILVAPWLLEFCPVAFGSTYLVNPDGSGDYPTIQAAMDAAVSGDVIELGDGTFTGVGNRDVDFLGKGVVVRSRSGDPAVCIIDCEQMGRGFCFGTGLATGAVLEGVTVTRGRAEHGGGLYCRYASPAINNCIFSQNTALEYGGGVFGVNSPGLALTQVTFTGNTARYGGGVGSVACPALTLAYCTFTANSAGFDGGALQAQSLQGTLTVIGCTFRSNTGTWGGAVQCGGAACTLEDCIFLDNEAFNRGGAIECSQAQVALLRCTLARNSARNYGGGIHFSNSPGTLVQCTLTENAAPLGGGAFLYQDGITCENTIMAFSLDGAALHVSGASAMLTCCDLFGNAGGDWTDPIEVQLGLGGNFTADPCFCDAAGDDFGLWNYSPCMQHACGLIGAWPMGCTDFLDVDEPGVHARACDAWTWASGTLLRCTPNPFGTTTRFDLRGPAPVLDLALEIADVSGRRVRTLVPRPALADRWEATWDGRDDLGRPVPSGVYLVRLPMEGGGTSARVHLLR